MPNTNTESAATTATASAEKANGKLVYPARAAVYMRKHKGRFFVSDRERSAPMRFEDKSGERITATLKDGTVIDVGRTPFEDLIALAADGELNVSFNEFDSRGYPRGGLQIGACAKQADA